MKRLILIMTLLAAMVIGAQTPLPTCYHTYDEIVPLLFQYETLYPNHAKVYLLGHSQVNNLPIYGIKITNNVNVAHDRPAILFVGQVHAEEVLGVEITMSNIKEILENRTQAPYNAWLGQLEMWFVPSFNPDGLNVVTSNMDTSFRKNMRDTNGNGIFDYSPLVGYDIDGVDLNRNFAFNWVHGDTLMQPGGLEVWDYYRGPYPMSESETLASQQLFEEKQFVYSIVWHSSRSGNLSEKVFYSFNWKDVRPSPDFAHFATIATHFAAQIRKEGSSATYEPSPNQSRRGVYHDWVYQQYGGLQLLVEVGTMNLQPDSLLMVDTIQRATNGVRWFLNRALIYSTATTSNSMLTGHIRDAVTNEPLVAEIIIEERHAPWFRPRMSNATYGRFWRPLGQGAYTLRVRKPGYYDHVANVVVNNGSWTTVQVLLNKRPNAVITGSVRSNGQPISARITLADIVTDTLLVNGDFVHNYYAANGVRVQVTADGYFPYIGTLDTQPGNNFFVIDLSPENVIFEEDWEDDTAGWLIAGPWVLQNELSASGHAITDSWGGWGFYAMNCDVHIRTAQPITIPSANHSYLTFEHHLYTEWFYDMVRVEVSTDQDNWQSVWEKSGQHDWWHSEYIALDDYAGQSIYLRFRLTDVSIHEDLTDPGWTLDNIRVLSGLATSTQETGITPPITSALYQNFPNPFNPETTIGYALASASPVTLTIYNLKGQKIRTLVSGTQKAGNHQVVWNGTDDHGRAVSSGVYLYRLQTDRHDQTRKMILMK